MSKKTKKQKTLNILEQTKHRSQFDYAEIFRSIRTNIEFSNVDHPIKSIALTSTQTGEAKTTTAINLAFIFATKYERVLLIDGDLRKMMLHRYLKISNKTGLTNALIDFGKNKRVNAEFLQRMNNESFKGSLHILTAGMHVPNPSEILSSDTFKEYMEQLKQYYDFIIVDCAPVGAISDAIPVGNMVDGTVFVVSAKDTKRKDAAGCIELLKRSNVNVIGSILTKADVGQSNHYYYY